MFFGNVGWLSADCIALYFGRQNSPGSSRVLECGQAFGTDARVVPIFFCEVNNNCTFACGSVWV
jgi:hypothetical protein